MPVDDVNSIVLLHFNGSDTSTSFIDESGKVWTAYVNAQLDTAKKKWGTAAGLFDWGGPDYIDTPYHADFNIGSMDWTIDLQVRSGVNLGYAYPVFVKIGDGFAGGEDVISVEYFFGDGGDNRIVVSIDAVYYYFVVDQLFMTEDAWHHVEVVKVNSTNSLYLFIDGTQIGAAQTSVEHPTISGGVQVGSGVDGSLDELRISNIARHTSNFTAPIAEYPAGALPDPEFYEETIEDTIDIADYPTFYMEESIDDSVEFGEIISEYYPESIDDPLTTMDRVLGQPAAPGTASLVDGENEDTIDFASAYSLRLSLTENEILNIIDTMHAVWDRILLDSFFMYDTILQGWHFTITDSLIATDAAAKSLGIAVSDILRSIDTADNKWDGTESVIDILITIDESDGVKFILRAIDESLVLTDVVRVSLVMLMLDILDFTDVLVSKDTVNLVDTLTFTSDAYAVLHFLLNSLLDLDDGVTETPLFNDLIADSLTVTPVVLSTPTLNQVVIEIASFEDVSAASGHLFSSVADGIKLSVLVDLDDEVYECWVLNTPRFHSSIYSGFDFNSYCVFEGRAYGANKDGIYELSGDTDDGASIHDGVILSKTTFGLAQSKRLRKAYLGVTGGTPIMVLEVEDGTRKVFTITDSDTIQGDRDVKGRHWKLSLAEFDSLDSIKLIPMVLAR
jgi:hypothetical protein